MVENSPNKEGLLSLHSKELLLMIMNKNSHQTCTSNDQFLTLYIYTFSSPRKVTSLICFGKKGSASLQVFTVFDLFGQLFNTE